MRVSSDGPPSGNILLDGLNGVVRSQRERLARLQSLVDREGEAMARSFFFPEAADAMRAVETYNAVWFKRLPYSDRVRGEIAQALLDASAAFVFVDTSAWKRVVESCR